MGLFERIAATLTGGEVLPEQAREEIELALALADRGELDAAEHRLSELARDHPRAVAVHIALGEVRARRGDDEGSVLAFGRAVDVEVNAIDAHLGLGEALLRLGRLDPARDAFRRVVSRADDASRLGRAHAGRGRAALAAGRAAKAVRELRRAAELAPEEMAIAADLGRALCAARDPEGWPWLHRAAQANIDSGSIDAALVIETARLSPKPAASEELLRAAIGVGDRNRARFAAALSEGIAREGRLDEARSLATSALAAAPDDAVVLAAWSALAEAAGDWPEALRAAGRAAELGSPPPPEALVRLALGAQDPEALGREAARIADLEPSEGSRPPAMGPAGQSPSGPHATDLEPLGGLVRRFLDRTASDEDLCTLGTLAPTEPGRRFVARAASPGPAPQGNLFALLAFARELAGRAPELRPLLDLAGRAADAFDRPLVVAVMGEFNAGKSSFVNVLCGEDVAPIGVTPTTATINVLRHGPRGARVLYHDGRAEDLVAAAVAPFLAGLGAEAAAVRQVEIFFPLDVLRRVEIVDTPGLNALRPEHERVARAFLTEADAIVWLFAVGQAAKATERDALELARSAGRRVLGVLNKADQAGSDEIAGLLQHVMQSTGGQVEALLPLSARKAASAQRSGDQDALTGSGLPAVLDALEGRFFHDTRALKRATALQALTRFEADARALDRATALAESEDDLAGKERALDMQQEALAGVLAAERVALPARLQQAFGQAATEVLELVRPRRWPFGERRAESADEDLLLDLLEDAVLRATEATRAALSEAGVTAAPALPIDASVDRFRAFARGALSGLVERFFREDVPAATGGDEPGPLARALARRAPDVETELFVPLAAEIDAAFAHMRARLAQDRIRLAMRKLIRQERLHVPLDALAVAVRALGPK